MTQAYIVTDLGFGDSGKGTTVEWLCAVTEADWVVRFNGGAQAAHNVVTPDGRHHTFNQFGSGTLLGVPTYLSRFCLLSVEQVYLESERLKGLGVSAPLTMLRVDPAALLTTPFHVAATQLAEIARGDQAHGSCGMGVGQTMIDHLDGRRIVAGQLLGDENALRRALRDMQRAVRMRMQDTIGKIGRPPAEIPEAWPLYDPGMTDDLVELYRAFATTGCIDGSRPDGDVYVFEGAQGVLLDEWRGFHPHTTWSTTTSHNADELVREWGIETTTRLGVVRSYMTRHGAGPLPTESDALSATIAEAHNATGRWQGAWRVGYPDIVAWRYAVSVTGELDGLVVTCLDRLAELDHLKVCVGYEIDGMDWTPRADHPLEDLDAQEKLTVAIRRARPTYRILDEEEDLLALLEEELGVPVLVRSYGMHATDKVGDGVLGAVACQ